MSCLFKQEMDAKKGPSEQAGYQKPDSGGSKRENQRGEVGHRENLRVLAEGNCLCPGEE